MAASLYISAVFRGSIRRVNNLIGADYTIGCYGTARKQRHVVVDDLTKKVDGVRMRESFLVSLDDCTKRMLRYAELLCYDYQWGSPSR
jgi:hypothetical protein